MKISSSSIRGGSRIKKPYLRGEKRMIKERGKGIKQEGHVGAPREVGKL